MRALVRFFFMPGQNWKTITIKVTLNFLSPYCRLLCPYSQMVNNGALGTVAWVSHAQTSIGGVVLYSIYLNVYTLLFIRFNSEYSCLFICTIGNAAIGHSIIVVICVNDGPGGYTSATHLLFVCWGSAFICLLVQTMSFLSKYVHLCLSPQATQWACNGERFAHHYYMRQWLLRRLRNFNIFVY